VKALPDRRSAGTRPGPTRPEGRTPALPPEVQPPRRTSRPPDGAPTGVGAVGTDGRAFMEGALTKVGPVGSRPLEDEAAEMVGRSNPPAEKAQKRRTLPSFVVVPIPTAGATEAGSVLAAGVRDKPGPAQMTPAETTGRTLAVPDQVQDRLQVTAFWKVRPLRVDLDVQAKRADRPVQTLDGQGRPLGPVFDDDAGGHHDGGEGFVQDGREGGRERGPTPEGKGQTMKDTVQLGDPGRPSESPAEPLGPVQDGQEATDFRAAPWKALPLPGFGTRRGGQARTPAT